MRSGLPLEVGKERNFEVTVEVEVNANPAKLFNVIGSIPGR